MRSWSGYRAHAAAAIAFAAFFLPASLQAQDMNPVSVAFLQGTAPVAPDAITTLGPDLFGDKINLFNGSFEFEQTDVSLPGNNALPVALVRHHTPGRSWQVRGTMADWDVSTPRIEGTFATIEGWRPVYGTTATRCSGFQAPPDVARGGKPRIFDEPPVPPTSFVGFEYWQGTQLVVPGQGSQEILVRTAGNALQPTDGNSYPLVTSQNWQIGCLSSVQNEAGQGFVAISPSGVQFRFDWMATRLQTATKKGDQQLGRSDFYLMATQVTDRFGNWVHYTYDAANPLNLTRIESNDGRVITLSYSGGRVSSVSDGTRTWLYAYSSQGDLQSVQLPDGSQWQFNLRPLVYLDNMVHDEFNDCDSIATTAGGGELTGTITSPSGATGTFTTNFLVHGRTNVTRVCTYLNDDSSSWTTGSIWPKSTSNQALISKQISGPGMATMTWTYGDEGNPNGAWTCTDCPDRKTVAVTEPNGSVTRHTFGIRWHVNEGQLLQVDEDWDRSSDTARKTSTYTYRDPAGQAFADRFGDSVNTMGDYLASRNRPQDKRVVTQQGVDFTWQADTSSTGFDNWARPVLAQATSSLGFSRTTQTQYSDNVNKWVLGQVASVTETTTGLVQEAHTYDSTTALPLANYTFGLLTHSFDYNPDGTLAHLYDGAGHAIYFQSFMRGQPQSALFADGSAATQVVNNLGNVASFTDEVGSTKSFTFDAMGRVAGIAYPTGDPVAYAPTTQVFEQVNTSEYGLPAGHWRQTITTGNAVTQRWVDAMWRLRLERHYDSANPAGTSRYVETRYDGGGRKIFESYPVRSFSAVDGTLAGKTTQYDNLNRTTSQTTDSELGPLTATTEYLSGFQRRVTDARGFSTTSVYQAFDTPSEDHIAGLTAPESVSVSIVRDLFGKPQSITRGGNGVSVTRSYVYDAYQRLCKTIEPEVGATVQDYDAANNLAWRAPGVSLIGNQCDTGNVPGGRKMSFAYDTRNRLTSTTYGDGSPSITRTYWADGPLKTIATSDGSSWTYAYNARRLLSAESLSSAGQTYNIGWNYDALGHISSLTYPSGSVVSYGPDALGEPTQVGGYANGITYQPNGAVAGYTLGNGIVHTQTQNIRGLPLVNKDAGVMQDQYTFDANGNVTGIADQQENIFNRGMAYDGLDRLTSANAPNVWGNASYAYDSVDNLRAAIVGSRVSTFNYDSTNRLSSAVTSGNIVNYGYDANGNISSKGGQTYSFDLGNRLSAASLGGSYLYDGHGRRIRVQSTDGTTRMQVYSQAGQLLWANQTSNATLPATVTYTCSSGTLSGNQCVTNGSYAATPGGYTCNAGDSLSGSTCTHTASNTYAATFAGYSCTAGDALSGSTCTHTSSNTYGASITGYSCNAGDSLSGNSCTHSTSTAATPTYSCPSGYTLSGSTCTGTTTVAATQTQNCNGHGSVQADGSCITVGYSWTGTIDDPTGHDYCIGLAQQYGIKFIKVVKTGTRSVNCVLGPNTVLSCPAGGTLSGTQCTSTVTQAATATYSCSAGTLSGSNCLSSNTYNASISGYSCAAGDSLSGSICTHTTSNTYAATVGAYTCAAGDALSGSTCTHTDTSTYGATASSYSCPSGGTLSGSTCNTTSQVAATPNYSCSSGTLSGTQCIGVVQSLQTAYVYLGTKQIAEASNGVTQYVHTDALGSPVAHTNASGALLNRARYEPYGYVAAGTKPSPGTSVIGFTGHVQDAETDLVYMQQRYYDPIAGRFLSVDPVVTDANTGKGFGLYTYVEDNPYRYVDPDGRQLAQAIQVCARIPACATTAGAVLAGITGKAVSNAIQNSSSSSSSGSSGTSGASGDAAAAPAPAAGAPANGGDSNTNTNPYAGPVSEPVTVVDQNGNAIPVGTGQSVQTSPNGDYQQVLGADGKPTGDRMDRGGHKGQKDPQAQGPHGHRPGVKTEDGNPHLPINPPKPKPENAS